LKDVSKYIDAESQQLL
jgi:hypothetical protein